MPIVIEDLSGIGRGIESGSSALASALEKRAAKRLGETQKDQKQSEFDNLLSGLESQGGDLGAFATAMRNSGATSEMALPLLKSKMDSESKMASRSFGSNTQERETYKTNQKLISGVAADAKMARGLLKHADAIEKAINSSFIPGRGVKGDIMEFGQNLLNMTPREVQLLKSMQKRSLLEMGDTKGIRITDTKLKFLQDNLWDPRKSQAENLEAYKLWKETLEDYVGYEDSLGRVLGEDENSMYDPTLSIRISDKDRKRDSEPKTIETPNKSNAKQFKGKTIVNENGERLISNGERWIKRKG